MRLSCPNCSTEYDVPDTALAKPGRSLRCGQCGHQWKNGWPETPAATAAPVVQPLWTDPPAETVTDIPPAPPEARLFGKPMDEEAGAEMKLAAEAEIVKQPEANTATGLPLSGAFEETPTETGNGFTDLMYAARKKSLQLDRAAEPEEEPPVPVLARKKSRKPIVILLVVLIVAALVFAEHGVIIKHVPASAGFFHALGLKS